MGRHTTRVLLASMVLLWATTPAGGWQFTAPTGGAEVGTLGLRVIGMDPVTIGRAPAFGVSRLSAVDGAVVWHRDVSRFARPTAMTVDASGDVLVVGQDDLDLFVAKLDGETGEELWRYTDGFMPGSDADGVAVDSAGDVLVVGQRFLVDGTEGLVLKFAGTTGTPLWQVPVVGTRPLAVHVVNGANAVVADASGDLFVAAHTENVGAGGFTVLRLAGVDGAEMWRANVGTASACSAAAARDVAVDAAGDVVAAGANCDGADPVAAVKLDGATGAVLWTHVAAGGAAALALDGAGNVLLTGLGLRKVDGTTGALLWYAPLAGTSEKVDFGFPQGIALGTPGGIVTTGSVLQRGASEVVMVVASLDAATGAEQWRRLLGPGGSGSHVAVDAGGDVVVGALTHDPRPGASDSSPALTVTKLRGEDGGGFIGTACGATICAACETCVAPDTCALAPASGCRAIGKSTLKLSSGATADRDRLVWRWQDPAGFSLAT